MSLPHGHELTFMFTDVEGSTELWRDSPELMRTHLEAHDRLLRTAIQEHGGHVFATGGDGFSVVFECPVGAARAAVGIQAGLAGLESLKVRIGMHTGASFHRDGDYFGPEVNRAARISAAGNGGQIIASAVTVALLDADALNCRILELGPHMLRGFSEPEPVFQLQPLNLPLVDLPLRAAGIIRHNLPCQSNSFVGREQELAEVQHLLTRAPMVTLVGAGGCGKTRLAIECGWQALGDFKDGVWLIELAGIHSGVLIPPAIAAQLGLKDDPERTPEEALVDHLTRSEALLLLDNCEHLLSGAAAIARRILGACPKVRILATSREPLGLSTEHVWRIPCLTLPPESCAAAELADYPASRLFLDRAAAAAYGFACNDRDAQWVAGICRRLDGIPLALELAAARVRAMSVEQIAQRLNDRFRLLKSGSRGAWERHQTLRAAIDWSHDLLDDEERAFFRRMAVFAGGLTLEAAEDVCAGELVDGFDVPDLLTRLVDRSLVVAEPQPSNGRMRYRQLETIREYGAHRLEEAGEMEPLRTAHRRFFMGLAEQGEVELTGPNHGEWLDRLQVEQDNFRAALAWSVESDERLRLAGALWRYWYQRGPLTEGRTWLENALQRSTGCSPAARAKAFNGAGVLATQLGDWDAAKEFHLQALELRRSIGDLTGVSGSLNNLALMARARGDLEAAKAYLDDALEISRSLRDDERIGAALVNLWVMHHESNEPALSLLEEAREIFERLGDPWRLATVLHNIGRVHLDQQRPEEALPLFRQGLELFSEVEDQSSILLCLNGIAGVACCLRDAEFAGQLLAVEAAIREWEKIAVPPIEVDKREGVLSQLREHLGEAAFTELWIAGASISLVDATRMALSWTMPDDRLSHDPSVQ